jgi:hypothetical protein
VFAQEQNEQVRVVATRIEWDGTMQRGMVDTGHCGGGPQWEDLTARALAVPPPYRPVPGTPVYHVGLDDGTVAISASRPSTACRYRYEPTGDAVQRCALLLGVQDQDCSLR